MTSGERQNESAEHRAESSCMEALGWVQEFRRGYSSRRLGCLALKRCIER